MLLAIAVSGGKSTAAVPLHQNEAISRACKVYCAGSLLDAVQNSGIFNDSKTFVDMPLKQDPEIILEAFSQLATPLEPSVLRSFVAQYFGEPGEELHAWTPPDFVKRPPLLESIADEELRNWSLDLNELWKVLGRIQDADVYKHPERHSALKRRFGMIVPGGRFRETYYWDSYWIVRGLLASSMVETARGVVENLLDDVRNFGFVPNGGRIYYLDRSQPPFLTEMALAIHATSPNMTWLASVVPVLEKEYNFWMDPLQGHYIPISYHGDVKLNRYSSSEESPRPESYAEDLATGIEAEKTLRRRRQEVWKGLRAGAESGWDFSSRWMDAASGGAANLTTVDASAVVPVDLNCVLYRIELGLSQIHSELMNASGSVFYKAAALQRKQYMDIILWNRTSNSYRDFLLVTGRHSAIVSLSDYSAPLWAGLMGPEQDAARDVAVSSTLVSLQKAGLLHSGGGSTTTLMSGQQWDAPNAWAPLQLMLVEGLDALATVEAKHIADKLASNWLHSGLVAWKKTRVMYEKYNAFKPGYTGGGGEYHPQIGFGWTNGVALVLLLRENARHRMRAETGLLLWM